MTTKLTFTILFFYIFLSYAQQNGVEIIEKTTGKRTLIFAKNTTNNIKSVFLKVNATGYRRSGDRPTIKKVAPNSKTLMTTLIALGGDITPKHSYIFVVNDELSNLNVNDNSLEQANVADIMKNEVVIFTSSNCDKCNELIRILKNKHLKHREININTRDRFYKYTWKLLEEKGQKTDTLKLPLASVKGKIIHPINNLNLFSKELAKLN